MELFDKVQRVAAELLDDFAVVIHAHLLAGSFQISAAGQADKGIAAEALAANYRFEQIAVRLVGEFEIERQRRVEVGQQLLHQRDAVIACVGLLLELLQRNHVSDGLKKMSMNVNEYSSFDRAVAALMMEKAA